MNPNRFKSLTAATLTVAAVLCLAIFAWQQRALAVLKAERDAASLHASQSASSGEIATEAPSSASEKSSEKRSGALTAEERVELMHLRSQVTDLRARQRALSGVTNQTAALKSQLHALSNATAHKLPEDYKRASDVLNRGTATPEAAAETFIWAVRQKDAAVFIALAPKGAMETMKAMIESRGAEDFFKNIPPMPGFRIGAREQIDPETVVLQVEVLPGKPWPMRMHLEDGSWRLQM